MTVPYLKGWKNYLYSDFFILSSPRFSFSHRSKYSPPHFGHHYFYLKMMKPLFVAFAVILNISPISSESNHSNEKSANSYLLPPFEVISARPIEYINESGIVKTKWFLPGRKTVYEFKISSWKIHKGVNDICRYVPNGLYRWACRGLLGIGTAVTHALTYKKTFSGSAFGYAYEITPHLSHVHVKIYKDTDDDTDFKACPTCGDSGESLIEAETPKEVAQHSKVSIQKIWMESDVEKHGEQGFNIHVKFNISNMKDRRCRLNFWLSYGDSGKMVKDLNRKYRTSDGQVAFHKNFTPSYENSDFNGLTRFIPYSELHIPTGKTNLVFKIGATFDSNHLPQTGESKLEFSVTKG